MISLRANTNSEPGFDVSNQESGCCEDVLRACQYVFQINTTPTGFTSISVNGTVYPMIHTYTTPILLAAAIKTVLTTPTSQGGPGLSVSDGDIRVYNNPYATTADALTIEIISGIVIDNVVSNVGTNTGATPLCISKTMCAYPTSYTLSGAIDVVVNNTNLPLTTYATAALLRTAIIAQIAAASLTSVMKVRVKANADGVTADVVFYAIPGTQIYHDTDLLVRGACGLQFV